MSRIEDFRSETGAALGRLPSLVARHPGSSDLLGFYGLVLDRQLAIAGKVAPGPGTLEKVGWAGHLSHLREIIGLCREAPTREIAEGAKEMGGADDPALAGLVAGFLREKDAPPVTRFMLTAFLGGVAPALTDGAVFDRRNWGRRECPVCGFPPVTSTLADMDEVEGARFLRCGLCHTDWYFNRTTCAGCGNNDDGSLHYYHPGEDRAVTIQACSACGRYIKSFDARKGSPATPELDDIATLALDLWIGDKGFAKVRPNLFGM